MAHRKKAPLLGVHGVKDTATGTAFVISRNHVSRLFRYLQLQSKTGYGQGKGRGSFRCYCACADQLQGQHPSEMLAKGRCWKEKRIHEKESLQ